MFKHLVTSGCSFSDNGFGNRWPHYLAEELSLQLHNYGHGSAGNDYISQSIIFKLHHLLSNGINPSEIAVYVMWSGEDREGIFISKNELVDYDQYINMAQPNPINFLYMYDNDDGCYIPPNPVLGGSIIPSGWLFGSPTCSWLNENITRAKKLYFDNIYNYEQCLIRSLNYILQLQWFCESRGIYLRNMSFTELMPRFTDWVQYPNIKHLYELVDFSKWIFWKDGLGLFEYTRDNNLEYSDGFHPTPESHEHFVKNVLIPSHTSRI